MHWMVAYLLCFDILSTKKKTIRTDLYFLCAVCCLLSWKQFSVADRASWRANKQMKNTRWFWRSKLALNLSVVCMMYGAEGKKRFLQVVNILWIFISFFPVLIWFRGFRTCTSSYGAHTLHNRSFRLFLISKLMYVYCINVCLFADRNIIPRRCNVKQSATKRCQIKQRAQTMQNKSICAWRKGKYNFSH